MLVYPVVVAIIEIILLNLLNSWCAHEKVVAIGFLTYDKKNRRKKEPCGLTLDWKKEKTNTYLRHRSSTGY